MTKRELLGRLSSQEMQEWAAYDRLSPIGADREDLRAVFIAWVIYQVHQPPKKQGGKPITLEEFMETYWPDWLSTPEEIEERRSRRVRSKVKRLLGGRSDGERHAD